EPLRERLHQALQLQRARALHEDRRAGRDKVEQPRGLAPGGDVPRRRVRLGERGGLLADRYDEVEAPRGLSELEVALPAHRAQLAHVAEERRARARLAAEHLEGEGGGEGVRVVAV